MNSTQRLLATLAGEPVDRRPVAAMLSLYGARLTGCPLADYYQNPAAYARGQAAVREMFQPDLLFGPFAFATLGGVFGGEVRFFADQAPNLKKPGIQSVQDWDRLVLPEPTLQPQVRFLGEAIRLMAAEHRGEVLIAACLPPPIDLPALIFGMEGWLNLLLFEPDASRRVMESILPWWLRLTQHLYAAGAALVAMPCAFASPAILPRRQVQTLMLPILSKALAALGGPAVLHHGGAPILAHLDLLAGLPSVVAFVLDEADSLPQARRTLGSQPVLLTGPQASRWPGLTPETVEAECGGLLAGRHDDPRFVLCNSGPDVPWQTPLENLHALRRVVESSAAPPR